MPVVCEPIADCDGERVTPAGAGARPLARSREMRGDEPGRPRADTAAQKQACAKCGRTPLSPHRSR
jgi:hypothetical protein